MSEATEVETDPLADLLEVLDHAEAWGPSTPPAHEVIALLPRYEAARQALAAAAGAGDGARRRALEGAVLRARLVLGRPRSETRLGALAAALASLHGEVVRVRFFVALALLVVLAAGAVGYFAVAADSRLGDLLVVGPGGEGVPALGDPLAGLVALVVGPVAAAAGTGPSLRLAILYGTWTLGLALGLVPLLALVGHALRWGLVLTLPEATLPALVEVAGRAAPDTLALVLAGAAGLAVAHRTLAPGRLPRAVSCGDGLRGGAVLWILALIAHGLSAMPLGSARLLGVAAILGMILVGGKASCESS